MIYNVEIDVPFEQDVWSAYFLSIPCCAGLVVQFIFPCAPKYALIILKFMAPIKVLLSLELFLMPDIDLIIYGLLTWSVSISQ